MLFSLLFLSCSEKEIGEKEPTINPEAITITSDVLVDTFLGNGPQWGGYDIVPQWTGNASLSEVDWQTLFKRLDFMRPKFIRIMISAGWSYYADGKYDISKSEPILQKMLDYCQRNNINVQFGEWGHQEKEGVIDEAWLNDCANFLAYLVKDKGYSCIKYFTMVNEPNGDWSSIDGNYNKWSLLVENFYDKIAQLGIENSVEIMGPDVAVWTSSDAPWLTNSKKDLSKQLGAFDIHTYPNENDVRSTSYSSLLDVYKASSDPSKMLVLGELGLRYDPKGELGKENTQRIIADPYASTDSQMFVYDSFYGIDVADATIQTMTAGYAGIIYWSLDDAMYNIDGGGSKELKRWGFWNILGEEVFESAEDEQIRPWFYPISLMCRYFPTGTKIFDINLPKPVKSGLRCVAGALGDKHTIAIVNNSNQAHTFELRANSIPFMSNVSEYRYIAKEGTEYDGAVDADGFALPFEENVSINLEKGEVFKLKPLSFMLLTNMK